MKRPLGISGASRRVTSSIAITAAMIGGASLIFVTGAWAELSAVWSFDGTNSLVSHPTGVSLAAGMSCVLGWFVVTPATRGLTRPTFDTLSGVSTSSPVHAGSYAGSKPSRPSAGHIAGTCKERLP